MLQTKHPYQVKDFSDEFITAIYEQVEKAKSESPDRLIAAFDADGTLWNTDVGEVFLNYQIEHMDLDLPENPYEYYKEIRYSKSDGDKALDWIVKVNEGKKIDEVRACASSCFDEKKDTIPTFEPIKKFVDYLHAQDFSVYIVTASCKWAVEPFGALFGIEPENVIGSASKIEHGIVTGEMEFRTRKEGKVSGLLCHTDGKYPTLAAGNTSNDLDLLLSATHVRIALQSDPGSLIYESEKSLKETALKENWFSHQYF